MKLGTKETTELVGFILSLGNALGKSMVDGKVSIGDLHNFVAPLLSSGEAFNGAVSVPAELIDLDDAERTALLAYCKTSFDIPQENVEKAVESALDALAKIHEIVLIFKGMLPTA